MQGQVILANLFSRFHQRPLYLRMSLVVQRRCPDPGLHLSLNWCRRLLSAIQQSLSLLISISREHKSLPLATVSLLSLLSQLIPLLYIYRQIYRLIHTGDQPLLSVHQANPLYLLVSAQAYNILSLVHLLWYVYISPNDFYVMF